MTVAAPERTGILRKLATRLPAANGSGLFKPEMTALNFTNRCNAKCAMCLEKGNEKGFKPYTLEEAVGVLRQIAELNPGTAKNYLHLWGGEPFLDRELLYGIVEEADKLGFKLIEIATNGFWGKDRDAAREILSELGRRDNGAKLSFQLSCDNFHQCQENLKPAYLANILYLLKTEFPSIGVRFNSLILNDFQCLHDVAKAVSALHPQQIACFDEVEHQAFFCGMGSHLVKIPISFFPVSLSGRCSPALQAQFGTKPWNPANIAGLDFPPEHQLSIGVDRQLYMNLHYSSPAILPMGSIAERPIGELIERIEADPIAVSLMRHGYAEIYPHLKELFNFDAWIRQFHSAYDVLQGLEADEPRLFG